jgi:hypothetical protein
MQALKKRFRRAYRPEDKENNTKNNNIKNNTNKRGVLKSKANDANIGTDPSNKENNPDTTNKRKRGTEGGEAEEFASFKGKGRGIQCHRLSESGSESESGDGGQMETPNKNTWTKSLEATGQLWSTYSPFSNAQPSPFR